MNSHKNARLTLKGRELLIAHLERSEHPHDVACAHSVSVRSVYALRRQKRIYHLIADKTGLARATVGRILVRHGLNRWRDLEPAEPVIRYEREKPGELLHMDIKKLGKFNRTGHRITGDRHGQSNQRQNGSAPGWEFVHVAIDDHSRIAFSQVLISERKECAGAFLIAAVAWYKSLGIKIQRLMTDNGSCYRSKAFNRLCQALGIKHIYTKPYTPKTNGKAERFIQSSLREWAYGAAYHTSEQRKQELPYWLHHYNWHRPHAGIKRQTPISRAGSDVNNLSRLHN